MGTLKHYILVYVYKVRSFCEVTIEIPTRSVQARHFRYLMIKH